MPSKVDIANAALTMIGEQVIASFEDQTNPAIILTANYEDLVRAILTEKRWRFATTQRELDRLLDAPDARYDAAYQIPTDITVLEIHAVLVNDMPIEFDRYRDKILCNAGEDDTVICEMTYRVEETYWPPIFIRSVEEELAAMLAISIAEDGTKADTFGRIGAIRRRQAGRADAQGRTAKRWPTGRLIHDRRR